MGEVGRVDSCPLHGALAGHPLHGAHQRILSAARCAANEVLHLFWQFCVPFSFSLFLFLFSFLFLERSWRIGHSGSYQLHASAEKTVETTQRPESAVTSHIARAMKL